jgi:HSP20 family protein
MNSLIKKSSGVDKYGNLNKLWDLGSFYDDFFDFGLKSPIISKTIGALDIKETDKDYHVEADVPGYKKEEISVGVENNILTISGKRESQSKQESEGYILRERQYASSRFSRSINLSEDIDVNKISASCEDGVLHLKIPKLKEKQNKKIEIKVQ